MIFKEKLVQPTMSCVFAIFPMKVKDDYVWLQRVWCVRNWISDNINYTCPASSARFLNEKDAQEYFDKLDHTPKKTKQMFGLIFTSHNLNL